MSTESDEGLRPTRAGRAKMSAVRKAKESKELLEPFEALSEETATLLFLKQFYCHLLQI
jgi:hypothetical protein